jgi:hypothetical protein
LTPRGASVSGTADYEAAIKAADEPPKHEGIFVANADGTFYCADCIPVEVDVSLDETQVWQEYSSGWTAPCVCRECKLSICMERERSWSSLCASW